MSAHIRTYIHDLPGMVRAKPREDPATVVPQALVAIKNMYEAIKCREQLRAATDIDYHTHDANVPEDVLCAICGNRQLQDPGAELRAHALLPCGLCGLHVHEQCGRHAGAQRQKDNGWAHLQGFLDSGGEGDSSI